MNNRFAVNGVRQECPSLIARHVEIEVRKSVKDLVQLRLVEILDGEMCTLPVWIVPMVSGVFAASSPAPDCPIGVRSSGACRFALGIAFYESGAERHRALTLEVNTNATKRGIALIEQVAGETLLAGIRKSCTHHRRACGRDLAG